MESTPDLSLKVSRSGRSLEHRWDIKDGPTLSDALNRGSFVAADISVTIMETIGVESRYSVYVWPQDRLNRSAAQFDGVLVAGVPAPRRSPLPVWVEALIVQVADELNTGLVS